MNTWWGWCHIRASSRCHISSLVIVFLSAVYKLWRTYLLQIFEVPCLNSQTQFLITFTIKVCIVKFMAVVISRLTFAWGMLFPSEIQWFYRDFTQQTVRLLRWSACRWWLGHFKRINFGGSATAGIGSIRKMTKEY